MTLHELYFNHDLVNDDTILRIRKNDGIDWVIASGHWYDDGVSIEIWRNKDLEVKVLTWVARENGSELYIELM